MSDLSIDAQVEALAQRYSVRAEGYDRFWSPVIEPYSRQLVTALPVARAQRILDVGTGTGVLLPLLQATAPHAEVLGVDNSRGMLERAARRGAGAVVQMNAEALALPDDHFDVAVMAFVLFHMPHPDRCLSEVFRVLRPGGHVGATTWGKERIPPVWAVWDEELSRAGSSVRALPAVDGREPTGTPERMRELMSAAGFAAIGVRVQHLTHEWSPQDAFDYQVCAQARPRLAELDPATRERCLGAIRERLATATSDEYTYRGEVIVTTAVKPGA